MDGIGILAGSSQGRVFLLRDGRWGRLYDASGIDNPVRAITSYRDRLLSSGTAGFVSQYLPSQDFSCPDIVPAAATVTKIVVLGDAVLLVGNRSPTAQQNSLTVLRPF
jgi:hypothetical protein